MLPSVVHMLLAVFLENVAGPGGAQHAEDK
jgi:hypothetical protein